ncbi:MULTISPECIES: MFS transporter [unclassified Pseudomonas]|uniref:MFS transporter n=1 Tax=unclassified Pseudomonas TaxID=196821 RepID=UPI000BA3B43A|nr:MULTISPECIES: MFS transporter [unclassified Pseudomonas]MCU1731952.1 MFS transporter [Pseudomonas sp. 20P_3.2_Bac4]MCU1744958.1 MFS transporter [Pseudomonas sp. 20P_3.2_Bac5]
MLQILVWGGSFFLLAVMAAPIVRDTGWALQWVYGALSLSLLVSAMLAPLTSRLIARFGGRPVLASSGAVVAVGLLLMSAAPSLGWFLLAWGVIGVGMALGLYEALFASLGALYGEKAAGAITGITLISGFASTLTWPLVALLIEHLGWRMTCVAYAVVLLLSVAPLYWRALPAGVGIKIASKAQQAAEDRVDPQVYWLLTTIFAIGAVLMTAVAVHLVSILQGQGHSLVAAIGFAAVLGPCQVGSRIVQIFARKRHPLWTTLISVVLVASGLLLVALVPAATLLGLVLYGFGNGLRAIVRGLLPLVLMSPSNYVLLMGKMSLPSLVGQAATPLVGGWLLQSAGPGAVLGVMAGLAGVNVLLVGMLMRRL